ncbi:MAG: ROK family protein, partial [Actinomycetes bacterium]
LYDQVSGTSTLIDVQQICELARAGDPAADQAIREPYSQLGEALVPWLIGFGASGLVVGGSISRSWDLVGAALSEGLAEVWRQRPDFALEQARHLDEAAFIGAAHSTLG